MLKSKDSPGYTSPTMASPISDPYVYHGESMKGTFHLGDHLIVVPVSMDTVQPGDVLVFRKGTNRGNASENVVHRVVALAPTGVIMRGDSNPYNDDDPIMADDIIGLVTHVNCNGKIYPVHGGVRGRVQGRLLNFRHSFPRRVSRSFWQRVAPLPFLRLPYRWLRSSGLVPRLWHPPVTRIRLETEDGPLVKFVVGKRTAACWWPQNNHFWCRKPYDLIIPKPSNDP